MSFSWLNLALVTAAVAALAAACFLGTTPMSVSRVLAALLGQAPAGDSLVVWHIRLPRAAAAFVVGAALGASGAALQGLLRNPLAEPGVLGVSASASLAATFVLYYGLAGAWAYSVPVAAITGASAASALIALVALRTSSVVTLILVGVGLSSFAGATMALLMNLAPNPFSLVDMVNWMLGSVANRSADDLALALPFLAVGLAVLFMTRRGLSALTLGEEAAAGVGLNLRRQRLAVVLGTGLATGAAVAIAGTIGFCRHHCPAPGAPPRRSRPGAQPAALGPAGRGDSGVGRHRRSPATDRLGAEAGCGCRPDRRAGLCVDHPAAEGGS